MAESPKPKKDTMDKLADDLDSMLDETENSTQQQDKLIDDEDAIDRLLMDDAFDGQNKEEPDEFAEIDELINDNLEEPDIQPVNNDKEAVDEFGEDELTEPENNEPESLNNNDEFSDADGDKNDRISQENDTDDLMANFDISADDSKPGGKQPDDEQVELVVEQSMESATESVVKQSPRKASIVPTGKVPDSSLADINAQLVALQNAQQVMTQQINDLNDNSPTATILTGLQNDQKKLKRRLNSVEEKKPVMAYVAMAIAIFAFLTGGGLGIVGFLASAKVDALSERVVDIEDQLEAQAEEDIVKKIDTLSTRLDKINSKVATYSALLTTLKKTVDTLSDQQKDENLHQQLTQLGDQNMQMGAAIESLERQLDRLENKKRSVRKKSAILKQKWVVNLISFRQKWYAKRKAAEFEQQGVPVEVMKVVIKGKIWFRLRVKGFNSKKEAAAYATKTKKSLNLTSVWVTKDRGR